MPKFSLLTYFDNIEKEEFLLINSAFLIVIIPGLIIGLLLQVQWVTYTAIVVSSMFFIWNAFYTYANLKFSKLEKEILIKAPNFPVQDFCDICGKPLTDAVSTIEENVLVIICPYCHGENVIKAEEDKVL
ncbi:MAG: hypothetical protein ACTSQE_02050 [Candidatus Heimdallarchaeaceae archaeon]